MNKKKSCWVPIIFGIVLIVIGLFFPTPGTALTTYSSLGGESTDSYVMGNTYSAIDEYVGGDAYNFIIGSALIAGKLSGAMMVKGIFIVGGLLCLCAGITMFTMLKNSSASCAESENNNEQSAIADAVNVSNSSEFPVTTDTTENSNKVEDSELNIQK